jgi:hypothetical protein
MSLQGISRGLHRLGILLTTVVLSVVTTNPALSKDIPICGASDGYAYFPEAGPLHDLPDHGKWVKDGITQGRATLSSEGDKLDLLFTDASGAVISATNDGGKVILLGKNKEALSVVINYPGKTVETWTFINSRNGAEAIWSIHKYGTAMPKLAAFRAPCSFLDLESVADGFRR